MDPITRLALTYHDIGWSVLPCHVPVRGGCSCGRDYCDWPGKHPRVSWTPYTTERPDRDTVRRWFEYEFYGSNIGIATGLVSGVAVVDVDHGALDSFLGLKLPWTGLVALSGSGEGVHFYYRLDKPLRSGAPAENVDLKSDGGFIVVPPSRHVSGRRYMWYHTARLGTLDPSSLASQIATPSVNGHGWYDELLEGCYEGERSKSLVRLAGRYVSAGLSITETRMMLMSWNRESVHPPLPEQEIDRAINWAYRARESSVREIVTVGDVMKVLKGI